MLPALHSLVQFSPSIYIFFPPPPQPSVSLLFIPFFTRFTKRRIEIFSNDRGWNDRARTTRPDGRYIFLRANVSK